MCVSWINFQWYERNLLMPLNKTLPHDSSWMRFMSAHLLFLKKKGITRFFSFYYYLSPGSILCWFVVCVKWILQLTCTFPFLFCLSRATSNKKLRETVSLELSFVNSNLQLLKEQLAVLNSSVEVYQGDQHGGLTHHIPMIPLGLKETKEVPFHDALHVRLCFIHLFFKVLKFFNFCGVFKKITGIYRRSLQRQSRWLPGGYRRIVRLAPGKKTKTKQKQNVEQTPKTCLLGSFVLFQLPAMILDKYSWRR